MNPTYLLCAATSLCLAMAASAEPMDSLAKGFVSPPNSAKPQTWWHWMNGNITRIGITADLEAMKQIGLGGATVVNVDSGIPAGDVPFMSPEWRDAFRFAMQEANRLGLDMTVENCAGWSSSGGPWNTPENAMQRVTMSELRVTGPVNFSSALPQPPMKLNFYRDIAVLAFRAPDEESVRMKDSAPIASASSDAGAANKIVDGDDKTLIRLPSPKPGAPQFVQLEFKKPFAARTVKLTGASPMPVGQGEVSVSDDGLTFRMIKKFSFGRKASTLLSVTQGAEPLAARYWRVQFMAMSAREKATALPLAEIELMTSATIEGIEAKAGFSGFNGMSSTENNRATEAVVQRRDMLDLTSKLTADGKINWQVPAGKWVVLRFGHTPTGAVNHPAPKEGTGLECDKMSKSALDAHWNGFMQKVLDDIGPLAGKTLTTSLIDSYEVGSQNWTRDFRQEFQKRRGYDLLTFLPTFTGRVVDNAAASERFLWDMRRTIADLFAENYFGHFAELCRQRGLLNAIEPYTGPFEAMQSGAPADVVMGEFWSGTGGHPSIKLASSVAHIYGKTIVGAESFTAHPKNAGRWTEDPYSLKALGDQMFCQGVNRYIFHRYAMQPWTNRWPGMTMGQWGFHFERTQTWWNQGKTWIDYISRCQFLLQQGRAVADAAYFTGESAPVDLRGGTPGLPAGYNSDAVNADVLLHGATVKNGRVTLASGANYAVLILPPTDSDLTPQLLQRIAELVRAGATLVGARPQYSPSFEDFPNCDAQVKKLAAELWGSCDGKNVTENTCGQGRIVWGKPLPEIFAMQKLPPDFEFTGASDETKLAFGHRVAGETEIYFVSNQRQQVDTAEVTFRVSGKTPELWHPDTGVIERAGVWHEKGGRTTVRLMLDPADSVFVIFRAAASGDHVVAVSGASTPESVGGSKLEIKRAVYGATDGPRETDVTGIISQLVRDGQLAVLVDSKVFGGDPAFGHVKELRVDYVLNGMAGQAKVPENKTLTLPVVDTISQVSTWETKVTAYGMPVIKAWDNCRVELKTAQGKVLQADVADLPASQTIAGAWTLNFPPNWGAPASVVLDKLISWPEHSDKGVKYFSGTARYEKEIEISADRLRPGSELWLDLGVVKNFAEVSLNGHDLGVLWKPPFRANITAVAKPGVNKLEVKVTNLWPNRLIGDEQLPPDCEWNGMQLKSWPQWLLDRKPSPTGRLTFTTWHHWTKDMELLVSGLLGPVTLRAAQIIPAK